MQFNVPYSSARVRLEMKIMMTNEENELLTKTDRGTPAGELIRRYWQPWRSPKSCRRVARL